MIITVKDDGVNDHLFDSFANSWLGTTAQITRNKREFLSLWEAYGSYHDSDGETYFKELTFYSKGSGFVDEIVDFFQIEKPKTKGIKKLSLYFKTKTHTEFTEIDLDFFKSEITRVVNAYQLVGVKAVDNSLQNWGVSPTIKAFYTVEKGTAEYPLIEPNDLDEDILNTICNHLHSKTLEGVRSSSEIIDIMHTDIDEDYGSYAFRAATSYYLREALDSVLTDEIFSLWGNNLDIRPETLMGLGSEEYINFISTRLDVRVKKERWVKILKIVIGIIKVVAIMAAVISLGQSLHAFSAAAGIEAAAVASTSAATSVTTAGVATSASMGMSALNVAMDVYNIYMAFASMSAPSIPQNQSDETYESALKSSYLFSADEDDFYSQFDMQQYIEIK